MRFRFAAIAAACSIFAASIAATPALAADTPLPNDWQYNADQSEWLVDAGYAVTTVSDTTGTSIHIDGDRVASAAASLDLIDQSPVGYDRKLFPHWSDLNGDKIDTRNEILLRDLTATTMDGRNVATGTLVDPYTNTVINFVRGKGTSNAVQIDHIVPLSAAWSGGADGWDATTREQFANDPENLLAVEGRANSAKGDRLPGEWMPANEAYHCMYVAQVVYVAKKYDVAVTDLDRDAMITTAGRCDLPDSLATQTAAPAPANPESPAPAPSTAPTTDAPAPAPTSDVTDPATPASDVAAQTSTATPTATHSATATTPATADGDLANTGSTGIGITLIVVSGCLAIGGLLLTRRFLLADQR